jgi:hypothetical protein
MANNISRESTDSRIDWGCYNGVALKPFIIDAAADAGKDVTAWVRDLVLAELKRDGALPKRGAR